MNKLGNLLEKEGKLEEVLFYYSRVLEVSYFFFNLVNKNFI